MAENGTCAWTTAQGTEPAQSLAELARKFGGEATSPIADNPVHVCNVLGQSGWELAAHAFIPDPPNAMHMIRPPPGQVVLQSQIWTFKRELR